MVASNALARNRYISEAQANYSKSIAWGNAHNNKNYTEFESIRYSFYLGLTKECIDAILPGEKYGKWGGDGFSKYDLANDIAGISVAFLIDRIWKPKETKNDFRVGFNNGNISFSYWLY